MREGRTAARVLPHWGRQGRRDETEHVRADNVAGRGAFGIRFWKNAWQRPETPDHPARDVPRRGDVVCDGAPTLAPRCHGGRISGVAFSGAPPRRPRGVAAESFQHEFGRAAAKSAACLTGLACDAATLPVWGAGMPPCLNIGIGKCAVRSTVSRRRPARAPRCPLWPPVWAGAPPDAVYGTPRVAVLGPAGVRIRDIPGDGAAAAVAADGSPEPLGAARFGRSACAMPTG